MGSAKRWVADRLIATAWRLDPKRVGGRPLPNGSVEIHFAGVPLAHVKPEQIIDTRTPRSVDLWNTPTTSSGKFEAAKRSGDVLQGARRGDSYSFWDSFDALHKSLLALLAIATSGLILHALGVFC